jgi:membrane protease YdiL (CAAX protease family)
LARIIALAEVVVVFGLTHLTYRAIKSFTPVGEWDAGTNFTPGAVMIAVTILILAFGRRNFEAYGLNPKGWPRNLSLGLVCSLLLIGVWATGVLLTGIHLDSTRPPDPHAPDQFKRVAGLAAIALPAYALVMAAFRSRGRAMERIPPFVSIPVILVLLSLLPLVAAHYHHHAPWFQVLWLFLGAGFGEEIFFRGYIQSRVDEAFGRPFHWLGLQFGVGLLVSALLFGLIHSLNTVDYFQGRFDFGWSYGLEAFAEGILFGGIRAKTGSVLPGAITHGLLDVFARIPKLLLNV